MKKLVVLTVAFLMSLATFASSNFDVKIPDWDKPVKLKRVFTPSVFALSIGVYSQTHISIYLVMDYPDPNYTWRFQISCSCTAYYRQGLTWGWYPMTWLWDADVQPGSTSVTKHVTLPYKSIFDTIYCDCDAGNEVDPYDVNVYNIYHL